MVCITYKLKSMKKLITIFLVLFSFTVIFSQQKPTKEETLQYIKSELEGKNFTFEAKTKTSRMNNNWYEYHRKWKYVQSEMDMKSCILQFSEAFNFEKSYRQFYDGIYGSEPTEKKDRSTKKVIDFSRTESISASIARNYDSFDDKVFRTTITNTLYLEFHQKKSDGTLEEPVSILVGVFGENFTDYESLKIYKAFQHLRKLCGAPEPISFD